MQTCLPAHLGCPAALQEVGVAMLFNPTDASINVPIHMPLYYTGLTDDALVSIDGGVPATVTLQRDYSIVLQLPMAAGSIHTVVINAPA